MNYERLINSDAMIDIALCNQWARDPREGKALDCLHFDEHCEAVYNLKSAIELCLFSKEAGLKAALKSYSIYVCLYTLGISLSDIADTYEYRLIYEAVSKNVNRNWVEYYEKMQQHFYEYMRFLDSDSTGYLITPVKQFKRQSPDKAFG